MSCKEYLDETRITNLVKEVETAVQDNAWLQINTHITVLLIFSSSLVALVLFLDFVEKHPSHRTDPPPDRLLGDSGRPHDVHVQARGVPQEPRRRGLRGSAAPRSGAHGARWTKMGGFGKRVWASPTGGFSALSAPKAGDFGSVMV